MKKLLLGLSILFLQTNCSNASTSNTSPSSTVLSGLHKSLKHRGKQLWIVNGVIHFDRSADLSNENSQALTAINIALLLTNIIAGQVKNDTLNEVVDTAIATAGIAETAITAYLMIRATVQAIKKHQEYHSKLRPQTK